MNLCNRHMHLTVFTSCHVFPAHTIHGSIRALNSEQTCVCLSSTLRVQTLRWKPTRERESDTNFLMLSCLFVCVWVVCTCFTYRVLCRKDDCSQVYWALIHSIHHLSMPVPVQLYTCACNMLVLVPDPFLSHAGLHLETLHPLYIKYMTHISQGERLGLGGQMPPPPTK